MVRARCSWGTCNSDARFKDKDYMKDVKFFTFPKLAEGDDTDPNTIKCREWIKACARPAAQLNIHKIVLDVKKRRYYYRICSKVCLQNERDQMHHTEKNKKK